MKLQSKILTVPNTTTLTYGVFGDELVNNFGAFSHHRVRVISGNVDVSYLDNKEPVNNTPALIEAGKVPTIQNIYDLLGVGRFFIKANADSTIIITSWN